MYRLRTDVLHNGTRYDAGTVTEGTEFGDQLDELIAEGALEEDEVSTWKASYERDLRVRGVVDPDAPEVEMAPGRGISVGEYITPTVSEESTEAEVDSDSELTDSTKDELYARATELDIPGRSTMTKEELVEAIVEAESQEG